MSVVAFGSDQQHSRDGAKERDVHALSIYDVVSHILTFMPFGPDFFAFAMVSTQWHAAVSDGSSSRLLWRLPISRYYCCAHWITKKDENSNGHRSDVYDDVEPLLLSSVSGEFISLPGRSVFVDVVRRHAFYRSLEFKLSLAARILIFSALSSIVAFAVSAPTSSLLFTQKNNDTFTTIIAVAVSFVMIGFFFVSLISSLAIPFLGGVAREKNGRYEHLHLYTKTELVEAARHMCEPWCIVYCLLLLFTTTLMSGVAAPGISRSYAYDQTLPHQTCPPCSTLTPLQYDANLTQDLMSAVNFSSSSSSSYFYSVYTCSDLSGDVFHSIKSGRGKSGREGVPFNMRVCTKSNGALLSTFHSFGGFFDVPAPILSAWDERLNSTGDVFYYFNDSLNDTGYLAALRIWTAYSALLHLVIVLSLTSVVAKKIKRNAFGEHQKKVLSRVLTMISFLLMTAVFMVVLILAPICAVEISRGDIRAMTSDRCPLIRMSSTNVFLFLALYGVQFFVVAVGGYFAFKSFQ
eukprot:PhM_4_TR14131/c0_g3_i9/m.39385